MVYKSPVPTKPGLQQLWRELPYIPQSSQQKEGSIPTEAQAPTPHPPSTENWLTCSMLFLILCLACVPLPPAGALRDP